MKKLILLFAMALCLAACGTTTTYSTYHEIDGVEVTEAEFEAYVRDVVNAR